MYPKRSGQEVRPMPDFKQIHIELRRRGVTLALLPDGLGHTRFCVLYRQWRGEFEVSMRQVNKPGE